jgi:hypothetical protein
MYMLEKGDLPARLHMHQTAVYLLEVIRLRVSFLFEGNVVQAAQRNVINPGTPSVLPLRQFFQILVKF